MPEVRQIPGFPGYRVTAAGEVLSKVTGRPLRPRAHHRTGHLRVRLYGAHLEPVVVRQGRSLVRSRHRDVYVHVLVCLAWHGPPPFAGALVLHHDDDPQNNRPNNLRWGTYADNEADKRRNAALDDDGFDWATGRWTHESQVAA